MSNDVNDLYEFGCFCLDVKVRSLTREGTRVHLQPKTFDMLSVLVQRRFEVLSKQDLTEAVWPGIHVDVNSSVENQIREVRKSLGDGDYIRTIPKSGYQFVAPVKVSSSIPAASADTAAESMPAAPPQLELVEPEPPPQIPASRPSPPFGFRRLVVLSSAAVLVLLGLISWGITSGRNRKVPVPPIRRAIAVMDFRDLSNQPEHAWISPAAAEMLRAEIGAGARVRTIPGEDVSRMKLDFALADTGAESVDVLSRVRKSIGADLILMGSYLPNPQGDETTLQVDVRIQDTATTEVIASAGMTGKVGNLIEMARSLGGTLRNQLRAGDLSSSELETLQASQPKLLDAGRLYAEGLHRLRLFDATSACKNFERALEIEPDSPMIRSALADALWILGFQRRAVEESGKALQASTGLSRERQLLIEARFSVMANKWDRAVQIYNALWTMFPDDPEYGLRLAHSEVQSGNGSKAYSVLEQMRRLPGLVVDDPRLDLAEAAIAEALGDFKRERTAATAAVEKSRLLGANVLLANGLLRQCWAYNQLGEYDVALAAAKQARQIFASVGDRGNEGRALKNIGDVLDDSGDHVGGQKSYEDALQVFRAIGNPGGVAVTLTNLGYALRSQGDLSAARKRFEEAAKISFETGDEAREIFAWHGIGMILWRQGDLAGAEKVLTDLVGKTTRRKDKNRTATTQGDLAIIFQDQGRLEEAQRTLDESLRLYEEIGNKPNIARTHGNLGELQLRKGEIESARHSFVKQVKVAEDLQGGNQRANGLHGIGQVLLHGGDLNGAKAKFKESLEVRKSLKEIGMVAESHLALAEVALEEGNTEEACRYAREAVDEFHAEKQRDQEVVAQSLVARCLTMQNRMADGKRAAKIAKQLLPSIQDMGARLTASIAVARVDIATGNDPGASRRDLQTIAASARKHGYLHLWFEANLALGETDGSPNARAELEKLAKEARSRGLVLIAQKASTHLRKELPR